MSLKALLIPTLNRPPSRLKLRAFTQDVTIPKVIHQTFYTRDLPAKLQENVDLIRHLNPDWEYRFYDDSDIAAFIQAHYPAQVWRYFERIDPRYGAARADLFRYLLMYKMGGVYLDIKSLVTRPIELLKDDTLLLSNWEQVSGEFDWGGHYELRDIPAGEYQQWHIVCAPGHPCLKAVIEAVLSNIDKYDPNLHGTGKKGVLRVTGPIAYTIAIHRIRHEHPHRIVDIKAELGFEYNVYRDQSHEKAFKSHYSLQTAPVVRLGWAKRQITYLYALMQATHNMRQRRRANRA